jgi:hypothetical protein
MKTNFTKNFTQYTRHLNKFAYFKMPKVVYPQILFTFPNDFHCVLILSVYKRWVQRTSVMSARECTAFILLWHHNNNKKEACLQNTSVRKLGVWERERRWQQNGVEKEAYSVIHTHFHINCLHTHSYFFVFISPFLFVCSSSYLKGCPLLLLSRRCYFQFTICQTLTHSCRCTPYLKCMLHLPTLHTRAPEKNVSPLPNPVSSLLLTLEVDLGNMIIPECQTLAKSWQTFAFKANGGWERCIPAFSFHGYLFRTRSHRQNNSLQGVHIRRTYLFDIFITIPCTVT